MFIKLYYFINDDINPRSCQYCTLIVVKLFYALSHQRFARSESLVALNVKNKSLCNWFLDKFTIAGLLELALPRIQDADFENSA